MTHLAIYGGSFDPFHNGHLNTALAVQQEFQFTKLFMLPCKSPVLKKATQASSEERISMLKLGLIRYPRFSVDLREIQREGPSYMVDTLQSYRNEVGHRVSITLILGMDAFKQLPRWHQWQKIIQLCNLLVLNRPHTAGEFNDEPMKTFIKSHTINHKNELMHAISGKIYFYNAGCYDISSTLLREKIQQGMSIEQYLPAPVLSYIKEHKLYQYPPMVGKTC